METLNEEFTEIKNHQYKLYFDRYPTKDEQKQLFLNSQDLEYKDVKVLGNTRALINKLTEQGNVSKEQLIKELFDMDKEEILKMLRDMGGE